MSAQEAVELTAVPSRTLELEASELPGFIAGLPRLLTKHLYIRVSGSLTANTLNFEGFYGSGSMQIVQVDKDAVFKTQAILNDCSVSMSFNDIRFQCPDSALKGDSYGICASHCSSVRIYGCTFSGGSTVNKDYYAFNSNVGSTMLAFNICAEHCAHVALASNGGILTVSGLDSVDALHDNETGAYVYHGGIITIFGHTPDTLGGNVNLKAGGIIVKEDGTLL